MKKLLSYFMATVMSFSTVSTVFAAKNVSEAENVKSDQQIVLEKIKPRIGNTDEYKNFHSSVYGQEDKTYNFEWGVEGDNYKGISVVATQNGIITEYNTFEREEYPGEAPKTNINENLTNAQNLVKKLNPDLDIKVKIINPTDTTSFRLQRMKNGVPVLNETGYLSLTDDGKSISDFNIKYAGNYNFEPNSNIISKEDAQKAYIEKIGLKPVYKREYRNSENGKGKIYIEYTPAKRNIYINALDGSAFEPKGVGYGPFATDNASGATEEAYKDEGSLSEAELNELEKINGLMTKEQLWNSLKSISVLGLDDKFEVVDFNLHHNSYSNTYCAQFEFKKGDKFIGSAELNAKTGEILSFNCYPSDSEIFRSSEGNVTEKKADTTKANEIFKVLAGDKANEFKETSSSYKHNTNVNYNRFVNGIECSFDTAMISVNDDGIVERYYISYTDEKFPSNKNIMKMEEAYNKIFDEVPYDVQYIYDDNNKHYVPSYVFGVENISINAFTKEFVDDIYRYIDIDFGSYYNDIDSSYAKDIISEIAEYGVYFENKNFAPKENIKQKDFIAMLNNVFSYSDGAINDSTYDSAYRYAKRNGIIKEGEENRESTVTRNDAAKYIVRYMGCEDIAKLDIYKPKFKDVNKDLGYTSILAGKGIMTGDAKGNFNGNNMLKREDAAVIVYKIIQQ